MVVLTRSLNHISYMQKRTISYTGEVAVFSSALIPGALRPGLARRTSRTQSGKSLFFHSEGI